MPTVIYFIVVLLRAVVMVLLAAMLLRAVIIPVRSLFERLGWFQNLPLDISFYITYLLLSLLQLFLELVG